MKENEKEMAEQSDEDTTVTDNTKAEHFKACEEGCETIVDTGTYLTYGPKEQVMKLFNGVQMKTCDDMKTMPNIVFEVQGHQTPEGQNTVVQLTMEPEDYVLQYKMKEKVECVVGI